VAATKVMGAESKAGLAGLSSRSCLIRVKSVRIRLISLPGFGIALNL